MSLVATVFDEILETFQRTGNITLEAIVQRMEPAFQAEGYRTGTGAPRRILVLRLDEIGDCVLTSPFLRELRRAYPEAQIDLVVQAGVYPLMKSCPHVTHVREAEGLPVKKPLREFFLWIRRFCETLWPQHYDLCLVPRWDVDETYSLILAYFCGARERVGFSENSYSLKAQEDGGMNKFLTRPVLAPLYVVHEVEKNLFLLRGGLGIRAVSDKLELWLTKSEMDTVRSRLVAAGVTQPYIAVAVGTREARKTYPPEMLAKALTGIQTTLPFVLLGGPGEEATGAQVADAFQKAHRPVLDLVGKTPLRESAALVAMARLYMGGDTGLTHVAAAAKRPIVEWCCHPMDVPVSVLSPVARFAPWQTRVLQVRPAHGAPGCETLAEGFHEIAGCRSMHEPHCIKGIEPAAITAAAERLLGRNA